MARLFFPIAQEKGCCGSCSTCANGELCRSELTICLKDGTRLKPIIDVNGEEKPRYTVPGKIVNDKVSPPEIYISSSFFKDSQIVELDACHVEAVDFIDCGDKSNREFTLSTEQDTTYKFQLTSTGRLVVYECVRGQTSSNPVFDEQVIEDTDTVLTADEVCAIVLSRCAASSEPGEATAAGGPTDVITFGNGSTLEICQGFSSVKIAEGCEDTGVGAGRAIRSVTMEPAEDGEKPKQLVLDAAEIPICIGGGSANAGGNIENVAAVGPAIILNETDTVNASNPSCTNMRVCFDVNATIQHQLDGGVYLFILEADFGSGYNVFSAVNIEGCGCVDVVQLVPKACLNLAPGDSTSFKFRTSIMTQAAADGLAEVLGTRGVSFEVEGQSNCQQV